MSASKDVGVVIHQHLVSFKTGWAVQTAGGTLSLPHVTNNIWLQVSAKFSKPVLSVENSIIPTKNMCVV